jgi:hypothetical protein
VDLGRLVAGIVGSNPAQGMDVCSRLSVLCCSVKVEVITPPRSPTICLNKFKKPPICEAARVLQGL